MTLIEILTEHLGLTDDERHCYVGNSCPCDFGIFERYSQGQKDWLCYGDCPTCWNDTPIEK